MGEVSTIGLDIAKSVFQVHGVAVDGAVMIRSVLLSWNSRSCDVDTRTCIQSPLNKNWGM